MAQRKDDAGSIPASLTIIVVRSGGFAGLRRQWQVDADDDAEQWLALVQACPWGRIGRDTESRDRFVWRIEVRHGRARTPRTVHAASVPDAMLTGPWRALVDRVQEVGTVG
jgi:hypothetical protein